MAGRFVTSNYQKNDETNAPIRVQAETLTTWNVAATGSRTGGFVKARGSAREYGTIARYVTLSRTVGDGTDYNSAVVLARVPIMTKAAWLALMIMQPFLPWGVVLWCMRGASWQRAY